jgi:hypothetical protein
MKPKTSRRRIDVNVDELDRIITAAMQAPLSEAEGKTLRTAVHAMADRLMPRRNTEKTRAVLETVPVEAVQADTGTTKPTNQSQQKVMAAMGPPHLRERQESTSGTLRCTPAIAARHVMKEECTGRRNRRRWSESWGELRWKPQCSRWSDFGATPACRCSQPRSRKMWVLRSSIRRRQQRSRC